ncbi:Acetylajmalan esterase [Acorus calamus]|uniref:Acetylajmalan esterase n=1 Tax=Acorus calamus TaxID=4465 RepID=A0AAV9FFT9_ACOCL|nr:Acetylajmalan esterase [Acorus calamus]
MEGDSISDTGNLIREGTGQAFATIGHLPYGETYFHNATGRCSDGQLMIDFLATNLGLPFLNPYLDKNASFEHGVNFAVAGATALDKSFFTEKNIYMPFTNSSLGVQLNWLKGHLNSKCNNHPGKPISEVMNYVPYVVDAIIEAARTVIDHGAAQLIVPGNFPIGCMPSYLTTFYYRNPGAYDRNNCLKYFNSFTEFHNLQLTNALSRLRIEYPRIKIMYADYYNSFLQLFSQASGLGFDRNTLLKSCCGKGGDYNFDVRNMCGMQDVPVCASPKTMISWDGVHLTQAAYNVMADELMMGGYTSPNYGLWMKWTCNNLKP